MSVAAQSKSVRIDVRASNPVKLLLQEAARAAHKNVSEFLLDAGIVADLEARELNVWSRAHSRIGFFLSAFPARGIPASLAELQL